MKLGVVLLVALCLGYGVAQDSRFLDPKLCPASLTFFPAGFENNNVPGAWNKANQTRAGNTKDDQLYPVVLGDEPIPALQFLPVHFLMNINETIPVECFDLPKARRLQQVETEAPELVVIKPATFSMKYQLDDGRMGDYGTYDKSPYNTVDNPPPRVNISEVPGGPEGKHCITLLTDILKESAEVMDKKTNQTEKFPLADMSVTRTVCFYKLSQRPTATVTFNSCRPTFSINIKNVDVPPLTDEATNLTLYKPVVFVAGQLHTYLNGSPATNAYSGGANEKKTYFKTHTIMETPESTRELNFTVTDLAEGVWNFTVEASLMSDTPSLLSLNGADLYQDEGIPALYRKAKFMGNVLYDAQVNVVMDESKLVNVVGPASPAEVGTNVQFTWRVVGLGKTNCYFANGKEPVTNAPGGLCISPLSFPLTKNDTLVVRFMDTCRQSTQAFVDFGTWGSKLDEQKTNASAAAGSGTGSTTVANTTGDGSSSKNNALPAAMPSLVGALLGAALLVMLL